MGKQERLQAVRPNLLDEEEKKTKRDAFDPEESTPCGRIANVAPFVLIKYISYIFYFFICLIKL